MCLYGVEITKKKSYDQNMKLGYYTTLPAYFVTIKRFKKEKNNKLKTT